MKLADQISLFLLLYVRVEDQFKELQSDVHLDHTWLVLGNKDPKALSELNLLSGSFFLDKIERIDRIVRRRRFLSRKYPDRSEHIYQSFPTHKFSAAYPLGVHFYQILKVSLDLFQGHLVSVCIAFDRIGAPRVVLLYLYIKYKQTGLQPLQSSVIWLILKLNPSRVAQ
jgi:hypothetical protein